MLLCQLEDLGDYLLGASSFSVKCPLGTFFNVVSKSCEGCGIGMYQPDEGQDKCLWCPPNTSTSENSTKFVSQCKGRVTIVSSNTSHGAQTIQ